MAAQSQVEEERALMFRMLGPVELVDGRGLRVGIEGRRARTLLGMLLVHRNQLVSADTLIDGLWRDSPPAQAMATLHAYISKLRTALAGAGSVAGGERIVRRPPGYQLVTLEGEVDADCVERGVATADAALREQRFADAADALEEALGLVRRPVLADCRDEPFARAEVVRVEGIVARAFEQRADAWLALGRHGALIGELEALVADHPLHERFYEQLMLALYRSGRQAEA